MMILLSTVFVNHKICIEADRQRFGHHTKQCDHKHIVDDSPNQTGQI